MDQITQSSIQKDAGMAADKPGAPSVGPRDLKPLFHPRSVAVIGAAREPEKVGHQILANLIDSGFRGEIYPVNPKADSILGLTCYQSIKDVQEPVDLAVLSVPSGRILDVAQDCADLGVGAMIVISAGFREVGPEGARLEKELIKLSQERNVPFVGPNCLGVINTPSALNASFAPSMPSEGSIALMSQSGAIYAAILDWAQGQGIGFSSMVSLGNKADVDEVDLLRYWASDPATKVIIGYLEGLDHGREFMDVVSEVVRQKPVIAIKSGVTDAGARAAASHTGTLAGSEATYKAAFNQCGVIQAESIQDLFDYAQAFSCQPLPKGDRVAILTNAGGPAIMTADACERKGLRVATLSEETINSLRAVLPPAANIYNPIDVLGDAASARYKDALEILGKDPGVDSIVVILVPTASAEIEETARAIGDAADRSSIPILTSFMGLKTVEPGVDILTEMRVPNYPFPERAVEAIRGMVEYIRHKEAPSDPVIRVKGDKVVAGELIEDSIAWDRRNISDIDALKVVNSYGIKTPPAALGRTAEETLRAAKEIGYPVVLKVMSPDILHKSDIGAVKVGITNDEELLMGYEDIMGRAHRFMPDAEVWGVSVHKMLEMGHEVIVGMTRDNSFGPVMLFGLGGIYVEVLKDVSFRIGPLGAGETRRMIESIRSHPLLMGVRGQPAADIDAIVDVIIKMASLAMDFPQIVEAEINPLTVYENGKGAVAVDARMILGE